jgi:flagellar protein FliO/FliZ
MSLENYLQALLALVFVLALIGALAALARRFGFGTAAPRVAGRRRRLQVVEVTNLDARRRLVLVRRDEALHLILLGANSELLVERGIASPTAAGAGANDDSAERPEPAAEPAGGRG